MEFNLFTINRKGLVFKSYEIIGETLPDYTVKSEGLFFKSMLFYDHNNQPVLSVNRVSKLFIKEYEIIRDGSKIAGITEVSTFTKPQINIRSQLGDFTISGNFFRNDFTVLKNEVEVAKISRKQLRAKGFYGIAINASEDHEFILALVMLMEMNIQEQKASSG